MITVMLTGAALICEREQGTVEHLLVMPVVPAEIMLAKILANGLVVLLATGLSLLFCGAMVAASSDRGIDPALFGWLVLLRVHCRSARHCSRYRRCHDGPVRSADDPRPAGDDVAFRQHDAMESMPVWLQYLMKVISPTPHFVIFSQDVLYRGADASIVWREILATAMIGSVYFGVALVPLSPRHF